MNCLAFLQKKSNEEIANEVLAGKWDNGSERKKNYKQQGMIMM